MTVPAGSKIAIVGPTGAGKSTLLGLLPRFFDPTGSVTIDGVDIREYTLNSLRSQISMVLQPPLIFPLSVADNIAYGRPGADREAIENAARLARIHDTVARMPEGFETLLGEGGIALSEGEKQRITIARALLRDAPILILDEPTSALDVETEALVMEAIERLMEGRTTFIIAHRLSTIRRATAFSCCATARSPKAAASGSCCAAAARSPSTIARSSRRTRKSRRFPRSPDGRKCIPALPIRNARCCMTAASFLAYLLILLR